MLMIGNTLPGHLGEPVGPAHLTGDTIGRFNRGRNAMNSQTSPSMRALALFTFGGSVVWAAAVLCLVCLLGADIGSARLFRVGSNVTTPPLYIDARLCAMVSVSSGCALVPACIACWVGWQQWTERRRIELTEEQMSDVAPEERMLEGEAPLDVLLWVRTGNLKKLILGARAIAVVTCVLDEDVYGVSIKDRPIRELVRSYTGSFLIPVQDIVKIEFIAQKVQYLGQAQPTEICGNFAVHHAFESTVFSGVSEQVARSGAVSQRLPSQQVLDRLQKWLRAARARSGLSAAEAPSFSCTALENWQRDPADADLRAQALQELTVLEGRTSALRSVSKKLSLDLCRAIRQIQTASPVVLRARRYAIEHLIDFWVCRGGRASLALVAGGFASFIFSGAAGAEGRDDWQLIQPEVTWILLSAAGTLAFMCGAYTLPLALFKLWRLRCEQRAVR